VGAGTRSAWVGPILERAAAGGAVRVEITSVLGPSLSLGRIRDGSLQAVGEGGLFRVAEWAAAPGTNLLVDIGGAVDDTAFTRSVSALEVLRSRARRVAEDPEDPRRTHWLERDGDRSDVWCLFGPDGKATPLDDAGLAAWTPPAGSKVGLFAALPPSKSLADGLKQAWSKPGGLVQPAAARPARDSSDQRRCLLSNGQAAYRLVGRLAGAEAEYAWLRTKSISEATSGAAPRSATSPLSAAQGGLTGDWQPRGSGSVRAHLRWLTLRSPPPATLGFLSARPPSY
jgi:hypothetical protein